MSGDQGEGPLRVEEWEIELSRMIAGRFRRGDEELSAELLARLIGLKAKNLKAVQNWQAFLAQSLYNAAKNFIRHEDVHRRRFRSLDWLNENEGRPPSLMDRLAAPEEPIELRIDLPRVWHALTPEMRTLWQLLSEDEGNISAVAKRLGQPRKTVEYRIRKLKMFFQSRAIEP